MKCIVSNSISVGHTRLDERESRESPPDGEARQLVAPNYCCPATELEWLIGELFVLLIENKEKS